MKVTEEMVRRFLGCGFLDKRAKDVRWALESVLADIPEPVPGLFVLSEEEAALLKDTLAGVGGSIVLGRALNRAQRTLASCAVEPLSEELYWDARSVEESALPDSTEKRVAAELLRRCPKPAPKQRTPGQVLCETQGHVWDVADQDWYERAAAAVIAAHEASK